MDLTAAEIGAEEENGKGETGKGTTGILVGIIIVIITGMEEEIGVIHIVTGTATNTTSETVESIVTRVNITIVTVLRTSQEVLQPGESVTTRLDLGLGFSMD